MIGARDIDRALGVCGRRPVGGAARAGQRLADSILKRARRAARRGPFADLHLLLWPAPAGAPLEAAPVVDRWGVLAFALAWRMLQVDRPQASVRRRPRRSRPSIGIVARTAVRAEKAKPAAAPAAPTGDIRVILATRDPAVSVGTAHPAARPRADLAGRAARLGARGASPIMVLHRGAPADGISPAQLGAPATAGTPAWRPLSVAADEAPWSIPPRAATFPAPGSRSAAFRNASGGRASGDPVPPATPGHAPLTGSAATDAAASTSAARGGSGVIRQTAGSSAARRRAAGAVRRPVLTPQTGRLAFRQQRSAAERAASIARTAERPELRVAPQSAPGLGADGRTPGAEPAATHTPHPARSPALDVRQPAFAQASPAPVRPAAHAPLDPAAVLRAIDQVPTPDMRRLADKLFLHFQRRIRRQDERRGLM